VQLAEELKDSNQPKAHIQSSRMFTSLLTNDFYRNSLVIANMSRTNKIR